MLLMSNLLLSVIYSSDCWCKCRYESVIVPIRNGVLEMNKKSFDHTPIMVNYCFNMHHSTSGLPDQDKGSRLEMSSTTKVISRFLGSLSLSQN